MEKHTSFEVTKIAKNSHVEVHLNHAIVWERENSNPKLQWNQNFLHASKISWFRNKAKTIRYIDREPCKFYFIIINEVKGRGMGGIPTIIHLRDSADWIIFLDTHETLENIL